MKIKSIEMTNFYSYSHLKLTVDNQGLILVHGATGSGKSALLSAIPWCLFGESSRGGNVVSVNTWNKKGPTEGVIKVIDNNDTLITVVRIRGKPSENDLFWYDGTEFEKIRGKDLEDTQQLLNSRLGFTYQEYEIATEFSEFSEGNDFFTSPANIKKYLLEKLVPLQVPIDLKTAVTTKKKTLTKTITEIEQKISVSESILEVEKNRLIKLQKESEQAAHYFDVYIKALEDEANKFERERLHNMKVTNSYINNHSEQLVNLDHEINQLADFMKKTKCESCGIIADKATETKYFSLVRSKDAKLSSLKRLQDDLNRMRGLTNPHLTKIKEKKQEVGGNPYAKFIEEVNDNIELSRQELSINKLQYKQNKESLENHALIYNICDELRGILVENTIKNMNDKMNYYLKDYFYSELSVNMYLEDADRLSVNVNRNGNDAVFSQLSKGQRQLLKLVFKVAVMELAASKLGTSFNVITFDEAFDGLDAEFKNQVFLFLESLSNKYSTIFIVDHSSEFYGFVANKYSIKLVDGLSIIEGLE